MQYRKVVAGSRLAIENERPLNEAVCSLDCGRSRGVPVSTAVRAGGDDTGQRDMGAAANGLRRRKH